MPPRPRWRSGWLYALRKNVVSCRSSSPKSDGSQVPRAESRPLLALSGRRVPLRCATNDEHDESVAPTCAAPALWVGAARAKPRHPRRPRVMRRCRARSWQMAARCRARRWARHLPPPAWRRVRPRRITRRAVTAANAVNPVDLARQAFRAPTTPHRPQRPDRHRRLRRA